MLNEPEPLTPSLALAMITTLFIAMRSGLIPGVPGWLNVLALYLAFLTGPYAVVCAARWLADWTVRLSSLRESLSHETRLAEAISRMNHEQLITLAYALNIEPGDTEANDDPGLIRLPTGAEIQRSTIARIADGIQDDNLLPERSYQVDRQPVRQAYNDLAAAGIIEPAHGPKPPRIRDQALFEQIINSVSRRK